MKKLLIFLFCLFELLICKAQDTPPPVSADFKLVVSPGIYYDRSDSSAWLYKGSVLGWTKLADSSRLHKDYVPYEYAIKNVNIKPHYLETSGIKLDTITPMTIMDAGDFAWHDAEGTIDAKMLNNTTLQLGQETYFYGKAIENIPNGCPVMIAGVQGNHLTLKKVVYSELLTYSQKFLGVATQNINTNDYGYVTWFGKVNNTYTTGWSAGDNLYIDPTTSLLTNVMPSAPNLIIRVGSVIKLATGASENGTIGVRPSWGLRMSDLNDVDGTPLNTKGQIPVWDQSRQVFDFNYKIWPDLISQDAYSSAWFGKDSIAPSLGAIFRKISSMEAVNYCTTTMTVVYGTLNQGTVSDLCAIGGTDVIIQERVANPPFEVIFDFEGVERLSNFLMYGRYQGTAGHIVLAQAYNYTTATWDYIGTIPENASKNWYSFPIYLPNNYISSSNVRIKIQHQGTGINTHQMIFDYVDVNFGGGGGQSFITASSVGVTPAGNISSTNVQAALQELDNEKEPSLIKGNLTESVTGLQFDNTRQVIGGSADLSLSDGYSIPTTLEKARWEDAYTDRLKWDGGATGLVATTGRTSLGLSSSDSPSFLTTKLTNLTDGYIPYHVNDATGLSNSPMWTDGNKIEFNKQGRFTATTYIPPTTGKGFEMWYDSGSDQSYFISFDRTSTAYKPITFQGNPIIFDVSGGADEATLNANGLGIFTIPSYALDIKSIGAGIRTLNVRNSLNNTLFSFLENSNNSGSLFLHNNAGNINITLNTDGSAILASSLQATTAKFTTVGNTTATTLLGRDTNGLLTTNIPSVTNWDAAYTHSITTTGSIHGSTTIGGNILRSPNPSEIRFLRGNADNSVSWLSASDFRTAIGAGTSDYSGWLLAHNGDYFNATQIINGGQVSINQGSNITVTRTGGEVTINNPYPMVWPSAGLAKSNGSGWATSITDNSTNWNTAYSHSQVTYGNPHNVTLSELNDIDLSTFGPPVFGDLLMYYQAGYWVNRSKEDAGIQETLLSGTNIKTINGSSILGSGNLIVSASSVANSLTMNNSGSGDASGTAFDGSVSRTISYNTIGAQPTLVSGTNIKTVNGNSLLGSGNLSISATLGNVVTFNNSGTGASSGTTFDGSVARTISYNTIGAASLSGSFDQNFSGNTIIADQSFNFNNGSVIGSMGEGNIGTFRIGALSGTNTLELGVNGIPEVTLTNTSITTNNSISAGNITGTQLNVSGLNSAPSSSSASGTTGEIRITSDYIYVCVGTNSWKRVALSTW